MRSLRNYYIFPVFLHELCKKNYEIQFGSFLIWNLCNNLDNFGLCRAELEEIYGFLHLFKWEKATELIEFFNSGQQIKVVTCCHVTISRIPRPSSGNIGNYRLNIARMFPPPTSSSSSSSSSSSFEFDRIDGDWIIN